MTDPTFTTSLWRYPGPSGWTFVTIPEDEAPLVTHGWGRTPVVATVDGRSWETSVWRERTGRTLLAVPKRIRGSKEDGDSVAVRIELRLGGLSCSDGYRREHQPPPFPPDSVPPTRR